MDDSKILEECSSNESGWTMYIASPDRELDYEEYEDEDAYSNREQTHKADHKKVVEDVDSDDSMASDASSGPSYQGHLYEAVERSHGSGHAGNERGNKHFDKKLQLKEEKKHDEKGKNGNKKKSAAKSKNK